MQIPAFFTAPSLARPRQTDKTVSQTALTFSGRTIIRPMAALEPDRYHTNNVPYNQRWDHGEYTHATTALRALSRYIQNLPYDFALELVENPNHLKINLPIPSTLAVGLSTGESFSVQSFCPYKPANRKWQNWYKRAIDELQPFAREMSDTNPKNGFWIRPAEVILRDAFYYQQHPPSGPSGSHTIPVLERYNTLISFFERRQDTLTRLGVHLVVMTAKPANYRHLARLTTTIYLPRQADEAPNTVIVTQKALEPLAVYMRRIMMTADNAVLQLKQQRA